MNKATNREIFEKLNQMIKKEAAAVTGANQTATSIPGGDVKVEQVDGKHESHNKNEVGADKLAPQSHEQHKATDPSTPVKAAAEGDAALGAPAASAHQDVEKLGQELLQALSKVAKSVAGPEQTATSIPGGDVKVEQVDGKHESHSKNTVGADKLAPQSHEQHKATDPSTPVKTADETEKIASRELGRTLVQALFKQAQEQAAERELALYKEAGRRDFETMIAAAAQELQTKQGQQQLSSAQEKQAEALGAQLFETLLAQHVPGVQKTASATETNSLMVGGVDVMQKIAQLEEANAALQKEAAASKAAILKKEAEEQEARKMASWAEYSATLAADQVMARLRQELSQPAR